ncbi:MAG: T9SS type A sorting domain-containing protein [candidate division KSB1 bacterium]|nr:T9SS type A sorting domain-containing protein [candidate division KSB1 bacterium]MDZ7319141.1 T9SS type A sorting domain-containing protein [candidate division KSB1 bacterium]MDZ7340048.1 T9SS type A sorting domain-containing protein [candidate division KSB1 bacterium]
MADKIQISQGATQAIALWLSHILLFSALLAANSQQGEPADNRHRTPLKQPQFDIMVETGNAPRPVLADSFLSSTHRFNIHYTTAGANAVPGEDINQNIIPDYIEKIAAAFDESYYVEIELLHYREPPSCKNGTVPYDIYVLDLGNASGITVTELLDSSAVEQKNVSSYILFENDFVGPDFHVHGDEAIQTTAAHEFFHAVQLGYVFRKSDSFFFELTAVWMADRVFDDINKHFYYLEYFFASPEIPLNGVSFTIPNVFKHIYGSCIFAFYLAENFGVDAIRWIWEQMSDLTALAAVDQLFRGHGSDFETEFGRFATWNFFTGSRARPAFSYAESPLYPEIHVAKDTLLEYYHQHSGQGYFLTAAYYLFQPIRGGDFRVLLSAEPSSHWRLGVAAYDGQTVQTYFAPTQQPIRIRNISAEQKLVIIPCNVDYQKNPALIYFKEKPENYTFYIQCEGKERAQVTLPFLVKTIYPNPFSSEVTLVIQQLDSMLISIRIFNIQGQQVDHLPDLGPDIQQYQIRWRPPLQPYPLPTGIYFMRLEAGAFSQTLKLVLCR